MSPRVGILALLRAKQADAEEKLAIVLAIVNANHQEVRCDCATCSYLDVGDDDMHETLCDRCRTSYPCAEVEQVRSVLDEPLEVLGR